MVSFAILAGCSSGPRVRADVARGEPAAQLSIRLSSSDSSLAPVPVDLIQVNNRHRRGQPGEVMWAVAHKPGTPGLRLPALITYGVVPSGYGSSGPVAPLLMGDYEVRVNAGGVWTVTPFRITALNVIE
jgi:hypothetical protein